MLVSEAIVKCLEAENTSVVFGVEGYNIEPVCKALKGSAIRYVPMNSEESAGHAAGGCAQMTGQPCVSVCGSGASALKMLAAVAAAYTDCVPLIAITGQVSSDVLGRDVSDEADIIGSVEPFVKHSYLVRNAQDIPRIIKEAFYIASSGRHGPVLIDIPVDIQRQDIEPEFPESVVIRGYNPIQKGNTSQVKRFAQALQKAERPLMIVGGGVFSSNACEEARALSKKLDMPTVSTAGGFSVFPYDDKRFFGCCEPSSTLTDMAIANCDVLLIVGARLWSLPTGIENKTILHIDIDPAEIGKNISADLPLVGDCKYVLGQLSDAVKQCKHGSWRKYLDSHRTQPSVEEKLTEEYIFSLLSDVISENAAIVCESAGIKSHAVKSLKIKQGRFISRIGMNGSGFALPTAIGVKASCSDIEDREVICICSLRSLCCSFSDMTVLAAENIPVKLLILKYGEASSVDIKKLSQACGIEYLKISKTEQAQEALTKFAQCRGSVLLEVDIKKQGGNEE